MDAFRPFCLLAALAVVGCDDRRAPTLDVERDAAVDARVAAPGCAYAPEPLGVCEGFRGPEPACVVDIEGSSFVSRVTFDAQGRENGHTSYLGVRRETYDVDGHMVLDEFAVDGCVVHRRSERPLGDGVLVRQVGEQAEGCVFTVEVGGETALEESDVHCDCRDVVNRTDCEIGPYGPVRCVYIPHHGIDWQTTSYFYDDAGRRIAELTDFDNDGVVESRETWRYDQEGRLVDTLADCTACDDPWVVRWLVTYDDEPDRVTRRRDAGDDGWAEQLWRNTYDERDRRVLREWGDDDGIYGWVETTYDEEGGHRSVETEGGSITRIEERVIDGRRITETVTDARGERIEHVEVDARGALIERFESETGPDGALVEAWHVLYTRDARGLLTGVRSRNVFASGYVDVFTQRYRWSGPCPTPPSDYDGDVVRRSEPSQ